MTVRIAQDLGVKKITDFSKRLNIYDNPDELMSISLGSAETTLLKIEQDGFYELMAGNSEIMQQIIKMLSGRLRETNTKLQEALGK